MTVAELLAALADADPNGTFYWTGEDGSGFPRVTSVEDWGTRIHLGDHQPHDCPYCTRDQPLPAEEPTDG